jgi:hypothetical protein
MWRDLAEDREGEAPTGHEHAAYFTEGCSRVRDELQVLLAQHDLKTAIREGQGTHIALPPFDRDACGRGVGTVHADDVPEVAIPQRSSKRQLWSYRLLRKCRRTHQIYSEIDARNR